METTTLHSAVNSLLECSICLEVYRDPRNLPCGHTFCLRCLQLNDHRTCALCNRLWSLPIGGIQALPKNFALDSFISQLPKVSNAVGGLTKAGGHHETGSCRDPLCALCLAVGQSEAHHDHTSDGITGERAEEEEEDMTRCTQHVEEFVTAYCKECSECACDACIAAQHADHDCVDLNEADKIIVESIKKTIADYDKTVSKCRKKLRRLTKVKGGLGGEKNEVLAAISSFMSDVKVKVQAAIEQLMNDIDKCETAARQVIEECAVDESERLTRVRVETEDQIRKLQHMVQLYERQLSLSLTPAHRATFLKRQSLINRPSLKYVDDIKNIQVTNVSKWKTDINTWMRQVVYVMTDTSSVPHLTKLTNGVTDDPTPNDRQDPPDADRTSSQADVPIATASLPQASLSLLPSSSQSAASKKHTKLANLPPSQSVPSNMQLQLQSTANEQSPVSNGCEQVTAPPPYNRSRSASATPQLSVMPSSVNQTSLSKHSGSNTSSKQKRRNQAAMTLAAAPTPPPIPARPDMRYVPYVRSAQLLRSLTISQIKDNDVTMISAHKDKLLVSSWGSSQLYVYHVSGQHLSTIAIPGMLFDVTWTPRGDIACTTRHNHKVIIMSQAGDVIAQTDMTNPQCLSVSSDDVMYVADWQNGVYQSTDGGAVWSQTFQTRESVQCWQVVKIAAGRGGQQQPATPDVYWTLERKDTKYRLCAFSRSVDNSVVWRDVSLPKVPEAPISLASSRMVHDGLSSVLLTDQHNSAVHVLTTAGHYLAPLLTADHLAGTPWRLAVDRTTRTLYVGLPRGEIKVFALLS